MSLHQTIDNLTVFEMEGSDCLNFLNNQSIKQLDISDKVTYTAICNAKGRILFSLFVLNHQNNSKIAVDSTLSDNFFHYVSMRKFRMDLRIKKSTHKLSTIITNDKTTAMSSLQFIDNTEHNSIDEEDFWRMMFVIELPWITTLTTEKFIPQHVNLDLAEVISFDKGCYPGQEIVARLHYIGQIKKRMKLISYTSDQAYQAGESICLEEDGAIFEFCSPSVKNNEQWQAQAITSVRP